MPVISTRFFPTLSLCFSCKSLINFAAVASEKKNRYPHQKLLAENSAGNAWTCLANANSDAMPAYCAVVSKVYFTFYRRIPSAWLPPPPPSTRMHTPCKRTERQIEKKREEKSVNSSSVGGNRSNGKSTTITNYYLLVHSRMCLRTGEKPSPQNWVLMFKHFGTLDGSICVCACALFVC